MARHPVSDEADNSSQKNLPLEVNSEEPVYSEQTKAEMKAGAESLKKWEEEHKRAEIAARKMAEAEAEHIKKVMEEEETARKKAIHDSNVETKKRELAAEAARKKMEEEAAKAAKKLQDEIDAEAKKVEEEAAALVAKEMKEAREKEREKEGAKGKQ